MIALNILILVLMLWCITFELGVFTRVFLPSGVRPLSLLRLVFHEASIDMFTRVFCDMNLDTFMLVSYDMFTLVFFDVNIFLIL